MPTLPTRLPGYSYLGDGVSFTVNGQTYLTIASGVIGNQTLELVIYFEPNTYELTYVTGDPTDPDAGKWVGAGRLLAGHAVWLRTQPAQERDARRRHAHGL